MKNFVLAGNPNCGKTTLFNSLTGSTAHVGNWPGVTVDKRDGVCRLGKEEVNIIDLPGIYSLSPYTPEEVIARNFIIDSEPDCIINIVDVTNLERNLYLTTQLLEMDVPIVVALNMCDILEENGDKIDVQNLQRELGVPVVVLSALKEKGIHTLINTAILESQKQREGTSVLFESPLSHLIKDLQIAFHTLDVKNPLFHACKLAEFDELELKDHPQFKHMVIDFREEDVESPNTDYEAVIADSRYKYITSHYSKYLNKNNKAVQTEKKQDKIDKILTHKIWGLPIFALILFFIFHLVFSENFLFLGNLFTEDAYSSIDSTSVWSGFKGVWYTSTGLNAPGVIFSNILNGLTYALKESIRGLLNGSSSWLSGLICDGILGGIFAVISFLPQILLLFFLFSILEDSGYMARVAFILDRIFRKLGLSGRSFLPMVMGFGCSVPAMVNTRTIADEKERVATIRVIPFFSCGAKLPTLTAISGCIVASTGLASGFVDVITFSMYLLGMMTAFITVLIMRCTTLQGTSSPFIMELPMYHTPQMKSTAMLVWDKAKHFIEKAFTIILASTIVIWFVSHFSFKWEFVGNDMDLSILANLGQFIQPIFVPLGFGIPNLGWFFVVAAISGLIAKENVVATMGTLAACLLGGGTISTLVSAGGFTVPMLLSFIAFNMLTIPCIATVATAKAELGKKHYKGTIIFWLITSYIVSSAIYLIGTYVWPIFIYILLAIIGILVIRFINKKRAIK